VCRRRWQLDAGNDDGGRAQIREVGAANSQRICLAGQ
jgi:hypothetical protein